MSVLNTNMKKTLAAVLAVATLGAVMTINTSSAEARWRGRGWGPGLAIGAVGGLAAGAIIAGAANPGYAYGGGYGGGYYAPAYAPAYAAPEYYDAGPVCHIERQRVYLDEYTYRIRRVRVCN